MAAISRKYLSIRYSLLPYYYTLFFKAHHDPSDIDILLPSAMVIKPLLFDFYQDPDVLSIDTQFLIGSAVMISPQLKIGKVHYKRNKHWGMGATNKLTIIIHVNLRGKNDFKI